jgi:hypothetical protein
MTKAIKKAIIAEVRRIHRTQQFPCHTASINIETGALERVEFARPYHWWTDLMHLCGQLEKKRPTP